MISPGRGSKSPRRSTMRVESLECRTLMSNIPPAGQAWLDWLEVKYPRAYTAIEAKLNGTATLTPSQLSIKPDLVIKPLSGTGAATYPLQPFQVDTAYNYPVIVNPGVNETIGIIDAYSDPNIISDLYAFNAKMHLPQMNSGKGSPTFTIEQPQGNPGGDTGWAGEISLDVEWAHAMAPDANIMLVESNPTSDASLYQAAAWAAAHGANVISMSFGSADAKANNAYDADLIHANVTFVAAAGDSSTPSYPALSPNVVAVGGTTLNLYSNNTYKNETAWSDGGGGLSKYEAAPSYQSSLGLTNRADPDVAYDADPNTGFDIYDTYGSSGWEDVGGTSAGSPQWAAIIADADALRVAQGKANLSSLQTLNAIYAMTSGAYGVADLTDITSGTSGKISAVAGYDQVTGEGTPNVTKVIAALVAV